jgi:hypothetical protein
LARSTKREGEEVKIPDSSGLLGVWEEMRTWAPLEVKRFAAVER